MSKNSDKRLALLPFRTFGMASGYAFLSAIFLGLALNLLVSLRVSDALPIAQRTALYLAVGGFFVAALGFFAITWNLENARNQWIEEGAIKSLLLETIEMRLGRLYAGLFAGLAGFAAGSCLVVLRSIPFCH
jgi:hypothetical protein